MSFSSLTPFSLRLKPKRSVAPCESGSLIRKILFVPPTTPCARYEWLQVLVAAVGLSSMVAAHPSEFLGLCDVVHGVASLVAAVCRHLQFDSIRRYGLHLIPVAHF